MNKEEKMYNAIEKTKEIDKKIFELIDEARGILDNATFNNVNNELLNKLNNNITQYTEAREIIRNKNK